jgi:hypothetical protein
VSNQLSLFQEEGKKAKQSRGAKKPTTKALLVSCPISDLAEENRKERLTQYYTELHKHSAERYAIGKHLLHSAARLLDLLNQSITDCENEVEDASLADVNLLSSAADRLLKNGDRFTESAFEFESYALGLTSFVRD